MSFIENNTGLNNQIKMAYLMKPVNIRRPISPWEGQWINQSLNAPQKGQINQIRYETDYIQICKENSYLKEYNQVLKKQLACLRKQVSSTKFTEMNDLRDTIKNQSGKITEFKNKIDVLAKQCKIYQEIIDKMQVKMDRITKDNARLREIIDARKGQDSLIAHFQQKLQEVIKNYKKLELKHDEDLKDWDIFRKQFQHQKNYYLNRINQLQHMAKKFIIKKPQELTKSDGSNAIKKQQTL